MISPHLILTAVLVSVVSSPEPIQWTSDPERGFAQAKHTDLPVLLYVDDPSPDEEESDAEHERALADPVVVRLVRERFVALRLRPSIVTETLFQQMNVTDATMSCVVVATPNGGLIGVIPGDKVAQAESLAKQLVQMYRAYRNNLFEETLKTTLESESAKSAEILEALDVIARLQIIEADQCVIQLLDREKLEGSVRRRAYRTLAALSTDRGIEALLKAAPDHEAAVEALQNGTPATAELLLSALDPKRPNRLIVGYEAVGKICDLTGAKPRAFWTEADEEQQLAELERTKKAADGCIATWWAEHGDAR